VTQLNGLVHDALQTELGRVMVAGEISNLKAPPSGHLYFTLKDDRSQIRCVMFQRAAQVLLFRVRDGQQVIARGQVDVYPQRGDLQLYVDMLEPEGRGALQLAFEQLKERLAASGLFDEGRKRPLPFFPRHIGIVTALNGAALHDMLTILRSRCAGLHVVLRPVRVQGQGAADDIVEAIGDLNEQPDLEVLIVGRGGGSLEDLWPFNEEKVARAIAGSRLPVVSAVGHEVDFTIADWVSDRRAPTPSAAAEMVVPRAADLAGKVAHCAECLVVALRRELERERRRVAGLAGRVRDPRRRLAELRARLTRVEEHLNDAAARLLARAVAATAAAERRLALRHPAARAAQYAQTLDAVARRLEVAARHAVTRAHDRLGGAAGALNGLSPLAVLQRGYSLTRRLPEREIVRDATRLGAGDAIEIRFATGTADATVVRTRS
jgi:exodeoxyribonuclease VII large subunit